MSRFFGNPDRSRRSKEISFQEDLRVLVEEQEKHGLHKDKPKVRTVLAPRKVTKNRKTEPANVSAIFDGQVTGAEIWLNGKFTELLKNSTYDPALGYPITADDHDTRLDSETVFDNMRNPLEHESYEDLHGGENDEAVVGSLGGGGEFSTGEIML